LTENKSGLNFSDCVLNINNSILDSNTGSYIMELSSSNVTIDKLSMKSNIVNDHGIIVQEESSIIITNSVLSDNIVHNDALLHAYNCQVTITNTRLDNNGTAYLGTVFVYQNNIKLTNCSLCNNSVKDGSAVRSSDAVCEINSCNISNNYGKHNGGGLRASNSSVYIVNSLLADNESKNGGGLYCDDKSVLEIIDTQILNNNGFDMGGGIYMNGSTLTEFRNNTISNNNATNGGGIYLKDTTVEGTFESPKFHLNSIIGNIAEYGSGGGIYLLNTTMYTSSNIIKGNKADMNGGGIFADITLSNTDKLFLTNTIFEENKASDNGGGIYCRGTINLDIEYSLFDSNTSAAGSTVFVKNSGDTKINGCKLDNNNSLNSLDGSISVRNADVSSKITISESEINNERGAALYILQTGADIEVSIINSAVLSCDTKTNGVIYLEASELYILTSNVINTLIKNNNSSRASGVYYAGSTNAGYIHNSLISGNVGENGIHALYSAKNAIINVNNTTVTSNGEPNSEYYSVLGDETMRFTNSIVKDNLSGDLSGGPICLVADNNIISDELN
jgi:large repetitive protein